MTVKDSDTWLQTHGILQAETEVQGTLTLLLLKMETLRCYGGGKASDLTGAKTKTHYVCLQCIALTSLSWVSAKAS